MHSYSFFLVQALTLHCHSDPYDSHSYDCDTHHSDPYDSHSYNCDTHLHTPFLLRLRYFHGRELRQRMWSRGGNFK